MVLERVFFFFQAEDGIRDADVTGVQTCALPIWRWPTRWTASTPSTTCRRRRTHARSEERRVGKSVDLGGRRIIKKKKHKKKDNIIDHGDENGGRRHALPVRANI